MNYMKFIAFLISVSLIFINQLIIAQNKDSLWTSASDNKQRLIVNASSNLPAINQDVIIKIKYKTPLSIKADKYNLGFDIPEGCILVSGTNRLSKDLKKGEVLEFETVIRFVKKEVFDIIVQVKQNSLPVVNLSFYVDGAFRISKDLKSLQDIVLINKLYSDDFSSGKRKTPSFKKLPNDIWVMPDSMTIDTRNAYETEYFEKTMGLNKLLMSKLLIEYDSLETLYSKDSSRLKIVAPHTDRIKYNFDNGTTFHRSPAALRHLITEDAEIPTTETIFNK